MAGEDLLFGPMRILGAGKAFLLGTNGGPTVPTATTWVTETGPDGQPAHCYVMDSVPYLLVKAQLAALPAGQGKGHGMFKPAKDLKTMIASMPHRLPAASSAPRRMSLAMAGARPRAGLLLDYVLTANSLLNINFGDSLNDKTGPAAAGQSGGDSWNAYYYPYQTSVTVNNLLWANGTGSGASVTVQNAPGDWANGAPDPMLNTYVYSYSGEAIIITLNNLPTATYDFYLYGHGPTTDNSIFELSCGVTNCGPLSTAVSGWDTLPTWTDGDEYVVFPGIPVASGQPVVISVLENSLGYALICGLQANATVAVPPVIVTQPANQTVVQGQTANFWAGASGTPPLYFQWRKNGVNIAGANRSFLAITDAQFTDAGTYSALVTNIVGSVTTLNATLTVNPAYTCVPVPSGQVGWWRAEGDATDFYGQSNGGIVGATTYGSGEVGQAFILNNSEPQPNGTANVTVPATSVLNVGTGGGLTVEGWIYPWDISNQHPVVEWNDGYFGVQLWLSTPIDGGGTGSLFGDIKDVNLSDHCISSAPGLVVINTWQHVALTYDKTSGTACLYLNGVNVAQTTLGALSPKTTGNLYFGLRPYDAGAGYRFAGGIDEVGVYGRALTLGEIAGIYNAHTAGKCLGATPPSITVQPQSQTVCQGANVSFSVAASGTAPLSYQWTFNGGNISGATASTYTVSGVQSWQAGTYAVTVSNAAGSTLSTGATLTVDVAATITTQPQSQTVCQ